MLSNCDAEEDSWESLDSKEIKTLYLKRNQLWIFTGRTDAEAEGPIFWPLDAKSRLIGKDPDVKEDWRQEEKGATEEEMAGWPHRLNGPEFEQLWVTMKDTEAWLAAVYGVTKSQTSLSNWTTRPSVINKC